jgi:hypothetical protein
MKRFVTPVTTGTTGILTIKTKNGNNTREAFNRLSTKKKNSCTMDIAHNKESAIMCKLKLEWLGAPLFKRRSTSGKETCDKR